MQEQTVNRDQNLVEVKNIISHILPGSRIILFGSRSRGDYDYKEKKGTCKKNSLQNGTPSMGAPVRKNEGLPEKSRLIKSGANVIILSL